LSLRLAQNQLRSKPEAAEQLLESSREELAQALDELRELARGIHPAILTDRGLDAALEALAARSPLPVEIEGQCVDLPAPVEAAAYYVVSEALANVVKYAKAECVRVALAQTNGSAMVVVVDDGVGGADPAAGSGLRGLADRVESLKGTLDVESPPGGGTTIRAEIPLGVG
jgi:signal transduction histidine kinase